RADIDIIRPGKIVGVGRAEKAETVLQNLKNPTTGDFSPVFRLIFQNGEQQLLLAQGGRVFDVSRFGKFENFRGRLFLELLKVHVFFYGKTVGKRDQGKMRARRMSGLAAAILR